MNPRSPGATPGVALPYTTDLGRFERFKNDLAFKVRRKVFDLFMREFAPSPESRVADFGVSAHREHPAHYFFESLYPHPARVTAMSREGAFWIPEQFPGMTYVECDLRSIPRPDGYFDFGICNAVIEHAGDTKGQRELVREVCRTCRAVMFTTPNRSFFLEAHTFVPIFHWLPGPSFRHALRNLGHVYFAREENLNPLDARGLLSLFPADRRNRIVRTGPPGLPTNLVCISAERR